ncbi:MAG: OsmC family protein [Anaerolineae bacterium]|jgi:putative redox protein
MAEQRPYGATLRWTEGMQFVATAGGSNHAIVLDGNPEVGGADTGMRPMEALLCALGSCTAMDVISVLQKKRLDVRAFEVRLAGQRAEEHPKRYTHITLTFVVTGHGIPESAVERAIELSQTKYCGATASLNAEIDYTYEVREVA